jgi:hypothetical protein
MMMEENKVIECEGEKMTMKEKMMNMKERR